jgi:SAM-dependent methyltransferase
MKTKAMSERHGVWSPFFHPIVYEAFHHLIGARRWLRGFAKDVIRPGIGERVLDIGCGPGALLNYLPNSIEYIGFDRNEAYIARAKKVHVQRGEFICDDLVNFANYALPTVDVAVAIGILHHLDDNLSADLLRTAASMLKPGGRLITVDPCYHGDQSWPQRLVVSYDRGRHVRPFDAYLALCSAAFAEPTGLLKQGYLPFPHTICIMQATNSPASNRKAQDGHL